MYNSVLDDMDDDGENFRKDDETCEGPQRERLLTDIQKEIAYKIKWAVLDRVGYPDQLVRVETNWVEANRWRATLVMRVNGKITRPHSYILHYQDHEVIADPTTPLINLYKILEVPEKVEA